MLLASQTAIITGGARGIGAAIALELAHHGANIAICDIGPRSEAECVLGKIKKLGRKTLFFQADVADRLAVDDMIEKTVVHFGRLNVLVNNAGKNLRKALIDLEPLDVEHVWNTVLWGAFHCSQLAARKMIAQGTGGNIVMISSVHAVRAYPNSAPYNGAKAAVNHMAATWAAELAPYSIRVNSIEPGFTDTPGERTFHSEEQIREIGSKLPLGRLGAPDDIARAVRFLVSDDASYITGACLRVDGGFILPRQSNKS